MKKLFITIVAVILVLGLVTIGLAQTAKNPDKPAVQPETSTTTVANPEVAKPETTKTVEKPATIGQWLVTTFIIIIAGFIGLLGLTILYLILLAQPPYKINLSRLISEQDGTASMSRFQLLIFTFVISSSLFIITIYKRGFPEVNGGILAILGISSGSYIGSKGIQTVKDTIMSKSSAPLPKEPPPSEASEASKAASKG